jgi:drug/metabolite transporter (DMT)-like permease
MATAAASSPDSNAHPHGFGMTDAGLVLMAVIWGVNYSVVKAGLVSLAPLVFNGARMLLAAVVLFGIAAFIRDATWPNRADTRRLLVLGLLGNGLYQLLFIFGLSRTRAGVAALIVAAGPAWIAIISRLLGRERVTRTQWIGIALQLVGVGCVVGSTQGLEGGSGVMLGAAMIAAGSVAWGLFSVLLQPYTQRAHPLHLSAITMASGAGMMLIAAAPSMTQVEWRALPASAWGAVLYAGLGALVVAYLLFYRGVRVLGPTRTALYSNLQPVFALAVAWIMLHETPTSWQLSGAAFIMAGLLISRLARVQPSTRTELADAEATTGVGT